MPFTPDAPFPKSQGDNLRSKDWNDAVNELRRLDTDKLSLTGGAVTGPLSVSGGVGIGTVAAPPTRLEISSPAGDWLFLRQQRATEGGGGFRIHNPWSDGDPTEDNRFEIAYRTAAGADNWAQLVIHGPTGNVGIGRGGPKAKLDVNGIINASSLAFTDAGGNLHPDGWIGMANNVAGTTKWLHVGGITDTGERRIALMAGRVYMSGNLGIGTTNPGFALQVGDKDAVGSPKLCVAGRGSTGNWRQWTLRTGDGADATDIHKLRIRDEQANADRLVIDQNGNVGIGTVTTSAGRLTIEGVTNWNNGLVISGDTASGVGLALVNKQGHKISLFASGDDDSVGRDGFAIYDDTLNVYRLAITANGNVGIGTASPGFPLTFTNALGDKISLWGQSGNSYGFGIQGNLLQIHTDTAGSDIAFGHGSSGSFTERMRVKGTGSVGIGTNAPDRMLTIQTSGGTYLNTKANSGAVELLIGADSGGGIVSTMTNHNLELRAGSNSTKVTVFASGDVNFVGRIGTNGFSATPKQSGWGGGLHTWDIEAEGTTWSKNGYTTGARDVAENYLSDMDLSTGDVVCLDPRQDRIVPCEKPNDALALGVVSTKPALLLDANHENEPRPRGMLDYPVALCGRVPCRVTDENGPVNRGDLLTTSSTPGHAMKALPAVVDGVEIYRAGSIIGKALEALRSGSGLIEVFVVSS